MRTKLLLAMCTTALMAAWPAPAQTNVANINADLFRVIFRATCRTLDTNQMRLVNTALTESNVIASALGITNGQANSNGVGQFALVFNTTADTLQVVNASNGELVSEVIEFAGGASASSSQERSRFAFMFVPGVSNAIGNGLLDEHAVPLATGEINDHAAIFGKLQFVLTGNTELGRTNIIKANNVFTGTNAPVLGTNALSSLLSTNATNTGNGTLANFSMTAAFDDPTARVCSGFFFTDGRLPAPSVNGSTTPTTTSTTPAPGTTAPPTSALSDTTNRIGSPSGLSTGTNGP